MAGQPKRIPDSETLWSWFEEYLFWNEQHPVEKMDFKGRDADEVTYKIERPLSWVNFKTYLYKNHGIGFSTMEDYKANKNDVYAEYSEIIRVIDGIIFGQQYDGAATGVYQQNIVARRLGLSDKTDAKVDLTVKKTMIGFKPKENE